MKCSSSSNSANSTDDEHRLIARYACRLAGMPTATHQETCDATADGSCSALLQQPLSVDIATREALVQQLLHKNRVIAAEIENLKRARQQAAATAAERVGISGSVPAVADDASWCSGGQDPTAAGERLALCADLLALKQHKSELEEKMGKLRQCRKDLVEQLEGLMRLLRERGEAAAAAAASRNRSPELSPRLVATSRGCGGNGDESDSAHASPPARAPKGGGGAVTSTTLASGGRLLASSSLAGGGELLEAVGEISAAVADLVKEITRTPARAPPFNIPERS